MDIDFETKMVLGSWKVATAWWIWMVIINQMQWKSWRKKKKTVGVTHTGAFILLERRRRKPNASKRNFSPIGKDDVEGYDPNGARRWWTPWRSSLSTSSRFSWKTSKPVYSWRLEGNPWRWNVVGLQGIGYACSVCLICFGCHGSCKHLKSCMPVGEVKRPSWNSKEPRHLGLHVNSIVLYLLYCSVIDDVGIMSEFCNYFIKNPARTTKLHEILI